MFRRIPLFIAIPCALVCAFLLGRFTANPSQRNDPAGSGETPATAASRNSPAGFPEGAGPDAIGGLAAKAFADAAGKPIVDHARLVITEKRSLARSALLESLIERITRDNWLSVFEVEWQAREEGMISEREEQLFMQRFGEVAGVATMERFKPKDPVKDWDTHSGRHAMRGWAQADPASAMAWLEAQPEGNYRVAMIQGFVSGVAAQDPKEALHATNMLPLQHQRWLLNSLLTVEEAPQNLPFVQQWITSGTPADTSSDTMQFKAQVFAQLVDTQFKTLWNDRDGTRVSDWIGQFAGREFVSAPAIYRLASNLAERMDAPRVIELIDRMAAPVLPGQSDPISAVMRSWSRQDPGAAQVWLNDNRDSPSYDAATVSFVQSAAIEDPAVRRAWIDTLHDETLRAQLTHYFDELHKAADGKR